MVSRLLDLILSIVFLLFSIPIIVFFAGIVLMTSKGGAFYKQQRLGLNGQVFYIYKIRTMYPNNNPSQSRPDDPRVTPIGKFLRKTKIDELPQLWNVIKGDMSLVGPRPKRQFEWNYFRADKNVQLHILSLSPGLTGPTQIFKLCFDDKYLYMNKEYVFDRICVIESDYVLNKSVLLDLQYLIITISLITKQLFIQK